MTTTTQTLAQKNNQDTRNELAAIQQSQEVSGNLELTKKAQSLLPALSKAGFTADVLSNVYASGLRSHPIYDSGPEGESRKVGSYLEGKFSATLSEYANLTLEGVYDSQGVTQMRLTAKTRQKFFMWSYPATRRSFKVTRLGSLEDFITKYGVLKTSEYAT